MSNFQKKVEVTTTEIFEFSYALPLTMEEFKKAAQEVEVIWEEARTDMNLPVLDSFNNSVKVKRENNFLVFTFDFNNTVSSVESLGGE